MSDQRVSESQLQSLAEVLKDYESMKMELEDERSKYNDFFYRTVLAANKTINHPTLRQYVPSCYQTQSFCLHTDPTGKIGYLCLTSDQKVSKDKDLRVIGNLDYVGFKNFPAPNGTFIAFLSTKLFKVTSTDSNDIPMVLIPTFADAKDGEILMKFGTSQVTVLCWKSREKVFVAGLVVRAAATNEESNLADEKHRKAIYEWLDMGNMDNEDIKKAWDAETSASSRPPTQSEEILSILSELVPAKSIMYFTRCLATLCFHFAWIRTDNFIEIRNYDPFGPVKCIVAVCNACRLQIQRAIRYSGCSSPFVCGEHPELYYSQSAPLAAPVIHFELPPLAPFSLDQVLGYREEGNEKYFMVLRAKNQFGIHCYNLTWKIWGCRMPTYFCNEMLNTLRRRGVEGVLGQTKTMLQGAKVFVEEVEEEDSDEEDFDDEDSEEEAEDECEDEESGEESEEKVDDSFNVKVQKVRAEALQNFQKLEELQERISRISMISNGLQQSNDDKISDSDDSYVICENEDVPSALEEDQKEEAEEKKKKWLNEMMKQQEECLKELRKRNEDGEKN